MKPLALVDPSTSRATTPLERPVPKENSSSLDAAQKFEQIFLRRMVGSLLQTAKLGAGSKAAGSDMYDSMIVDALSTSLSSAGGLGLARVIQDRLDEKISQEAGGSLDASSLDPSAVSAAFESPEPPPAERPTIRPPPLSSSDSSLPQSDRLSFIEPIRSDRLAPPRRIR